MQSQVHDFSDPTDKSDKEHLHEELQNHLAKTLKACTRHVSYALPALESLDDEQGTEVCWPRIQEYPGQYLT